MHVREKPSLRTTTVLETPTGRRYRWAKNGPTEGTEGGKEWSSTMPGGWDQASMVLPRDPSVDYEDLVRLSTLKILSGSGICVGEYRLERTPSVSGDQMAITPAAVGWQANLDDNQYAAVIFLDADMSHWGPDTIGRRKSVLTSGYRLTDPVISDGGMTLEHFLAGGSNPLAEAMYDAKDAWVKNFRYAFTQINANADANWAIRIFPSNEDGTVQTGTGTNLYNGGSPGSGTQNGTGRQKFGCCYFLYPNNSVASADTPRQTYFSELLVMGDHGITLYSGGMLGSDMIKYVIGAFCDSLHYTPDSIVASSFQIPHCEFRDAVLPSAMVKNITRYELQDWAVWNDRVFYWHPRNYFGRMWKARVGPSRLEQTGKQVDRLWNSVVVQYNDVGGDTRTVGPVGSGANTEDSSLTDTDPLNPANQAGIKRRAKLVMGTGTSGSAIQVGKRFLAEQALLDTSGRATIDGYVEDDRGVVHPYHHVKAGDRICFTDAADTGPRRIVKVNNSEDGRSASLDLDAPPEGLQATLERLDVVLVPYGV